MKGQAMRVPFLCLLVASLLALLPGAARAEDTWQSRFGSIPIQEGGRVMPLDTFARRLAVDLTGRSKWGEGRGPDAFAGREAIELLADLIARPEVVFRQPLIAIDHEELKREAGLDTERRFFSGSEIMLTPKVHEIVSGYFARQRENPDTKQTALERHASEAQSAAMTIGTFSRNRQLPIIPRAEVPEFATVGTASGTPGFEDVQAAFLRFKEAYLADGDVAGAVSALRAEIDAHGALSASMARDVRLEHFYNHHKPWLMAAIATMLALLFMLGRWVLRLRVFTFLAALAIVWAVAEQTLGLALRIVILDRAPVSNTYEAILFMGIFAVVCGLVGQAVNRRGWYLAAGLAASLIALFFAQLVPLTDQTNSIPAVLRSNYWLILHVLTIVASYGAFLLAAVLGHAFLIRDVILRKAPDPHARLIVQTYRVMQVGLVLLTAGTILGGVWAAESWGRFWGWDPKETWALISIVVYFIMLHARYSRWIKDFGLAVASILGFVAIVWTFYGVNYVMATGLHSYGFGAGGEKWVALWAVLELVFLVVCFAMARASGPPAPAEARAPLEGKPSPTPPATA